MAKKQTKTYSIVEAMRLTGYCRALVSRLCNRGEIGTRHQFPGSDYHIFRLSKKDISTLKARKKQGIQKTPQKV